jgi:hypothetical protein
MIGGILWWFANTRLGRTVALAIAMTVAVGGAWWFFSDHYYDKGVAACEAEHLAARNDANVEQAAENEQKNTDASEVAKQASDAAQEVNKGTEQSVSETREVIKYVYRDPPATAPIAPGACVRSVDPRVQSAISEARRAANGAGSPL